MYVYVSGLAGTEGNILQEGGEPWLYVDLASLDFHLHENSVDLPISPELEGCIDTGDPTDEYYNEPEPNGARINRGAYGNTIEATIATTNPPPLASIQSVAGGQAEGDNKTFLGEGLDDGSIQGYEWKSDNPGIISIEGPATIYNGLDLGTHLITLRVQDDLIRPCSLLCNNKFYLAYLAGQFNK
jgi:hypothetical protein